MATIDLGRLGFVNKGTYNNSTTYEKNDLVQFTDGGILSTYLYIDSTAQSGQAPSSSGTAGSRWVYYAKGVADAVASAGNNKVLVTNASGNLTPLAIGSANQQLRVNSGGNALEFATIAGGAFAQFQYRTVIGGGSNQYTNSNSGSYVEATNHYIDITPTSNSASTKILVNLIPHILLNRGATDVGFQYQIHRTVGGSTTDLLTSSSVQYYYNGSNNIRLPAPIWYMDTPQTTSSVRYSFRFLNPHGSSSIEVGGGGNIQNHHMAWELN